MALVARQPEGARKRERPGTIPGLRETTTTRPFSPALPQPLDVEVPGVPVAVVLVQRVRLLRVVLPIKRGVHRNLVDQPEERLDIVRNLVHDPVRGGVVPGQVL